MPFKLIGTVLGSLFAIGLMVTPWLIQILCLTPVYLGPFTKTAIVVLDRALLGVDVTLQDIRVNPFLGKLVIKNLTIQNPKGYQSDAMLNMREAVLSLNMRSLVYSAIRSVFSGDPVQLIVKTCILMQCQVMVETRNFLNSNVNEVLQYMDLFEQEHEEDRKDSKEKDMREHQESDDAIVEVQKLKIHDIFLRFQLEQRIFGHDCHVGFDIALPDITEDNLYDKLGWNAIGGIVLVILKTFFKSLVTTIAGKQVGKHVF